MIITYPAMGFQHGKNLLLKIPYLEMCGNIIKNKKASYITGNRT
jgi:hypothetical protein